MKFFNMEFDEFKLLINQEHDASDCINLSKYDDAKYKNGYSVGWWYDYEHSDVTDEMYINFSSWYIEKIHKDLTGKQKYEVIHKSDISKAVPNLSDLCIEDFMLLILLFDL